MINENIEEMIIRQQRGELSDAELKELKEWYDSSDDNRKVYSDYCVILKSQSVSSASHLFKDDEENSWIKIHKRIFRQKIRLYLIPISRYAAVAVIAFLIGYLFLNNPGGISNHIISIEVPMGSKTKITLPDGSNVWLNAGSKLCYSSDFGKTSRNISLNGEGYFSVTKNKKKPFIITSGETRIRVLGTKFDLKAYADDDLARVTLLEGSLSISSKKENIKETIISPNQQAFIQRGSYSVKVRSVKAGDYILWTQPIKENIAVVERHIDKELPEMKTPNSTMRNTLFFDEEPLSQIVKDLSRAFNVNIELVDNSIASSIYYGDFRNDESIYDILNVITSSHDIKYEIRDNKILISKP